MTSAALQTKETDAATAQEAVLVRAWAKRRPAWTRTDSARWLNDRSEPLLAWLRRHCANAPRHTRQMGYWLKEEEPSLFERAHARLLRCKSTDRGQLLTDEVLR